MEKEYLNEENYQKAKKKIKGIAITIFVIGLVISSIFFVTGALKQQKVKKENDTSYQQALKEKDEEKKVDEQRLLAIPKTIEELTSKKNQLTQEMSSLDMTDSTWFSKVNQYQSEISSLEGKISELEMEKFNLQNKNYTVFHQKNMSMSHVIFYSLGGMTLFLSLMIALMIYFISKRREILAFGIQQTLPLAKEGMEKVTPTVIKTTKELAKGITEGIKEGLNSNHDE